MQAISFDANSYTAGGDNSFVQYGTESSAGETKSPTVDVFTLGRFSVFIDGARLTFSRKTQKRPLELLKALIAFGGKQVRIDRLAETLWPDAEADFAMRALSTTLYRLRKLLGKGIVTYRDGALTLSPLCCNVDLWVLERLFSKVADACRMNDIENVLRLTQRMLALHQGEFLESAEASFALWMRERLHAKLLRHLESAGHVLSKAHQVNDAIACYERGLQIDASNESMYVGLMRSYLDHGRTSDAIRTYNRCRAALHVGFGILPSVQTESLLKRAREIGSSYNSPNR